ncbi:glutamyl-tRNA reductase [Anaerosporobacter sp.]
MDIQMVGIDHCKASIEYREKFSFTHHESLSAMNQIMEWYKDKITGCVILSTCNRTELYISCEEEAMEPYEILCRIKGIDSEAYQNFYTVRNGSEVVEHLFSLACGLKSKVFGEDQIITQVKEALTNAREAETTDIVLEKLFQTAITAAKKVKSSVHLTAVNSSVVENMITVLTREFDTVNGLPCLVIGNGEIGKLAATRLLQMGAKVTMTLRQYKCREVDIPLGAHCIDYQERYNVLSGMEVVVSATASPHHTIQYEEVYEILHDGKKRILVDMAVPRDISLRLAELENIRLYNIDSLGGVSTDTINNQSVALAIEILKEYEEEFTTWYLFREYIPLIQSVGRTSSMSVLNRIDKQMNRIVKDSESVEEIRKLVKAASNRVVTNLLYGLKENLDKKQWSSCLEAIENASKKNEEV